MAIANGYATLAELKARIAATDTDNDAVYEAVIEAASRQIDGYCGRRFYQLAATARYFTPERGDWLEVGDLVSVTQIATDIAGTRQYATVWLTTDYDLDPENAADVGLPYTSIRLQPFTSQAFPVLRRGVKVTGTWGWPAVPDPVNEACLLLSTRLAKRPSAPFGIDPSAGPDGGAQRIASVDPDVKQLLASYRRLSIGAV